MANYPYVCYSSHQVNKVSFDWDTAKDIANQEKHGLSFAQAQYAFMNSKIKYTDEPLGKVEVIADMLPSPEELAFKEDTVKVTISLSKSSVDFFKREAKKHDTKYQQMIRRLLDAYTHAQDRHISNH
jgi:hypothetical protein